jgi:acyl-coenzyme A synthetase/AMP-(fatty) acid ligase
MLPLRIIPITDLPQNASGKVDRAAVRQRVHEALRGELVGDHPGER